MSNSQAIDPRDAFAMLSSDSNCMLLDVRLPAEHESLCAEKAILLPLQKLSEDTTAQYKGKKILCICQKGSRGQQAADMLTKLGFENVYNITGGTLAWENCGLPVKRGRQVMSIERQVRIAAGGLVALGALGANYISPTFWLLPLFVGCGLVFSGATDTCGMAYLLAFLPWNQGAARK